MRTVAITVTSDGYDLFYVCVVFSDASGVERFPLRPGICGLPAFSASAGASDFEQPLVLLYK